MLSKYNRMYLVTPGNYSQDDAWDNPVHPNAEVVLATQTGGARRCTWQQRGGGGRGGDRGQAGADR